MFSQSTSPPSPTCLLPVKGYRLVLRITYLPSPGSPRVRSGELLALHTRSGALSREALCRSGRVRTRERACRPTGHSVVAGSKAPPKTKPLEGRLIIGGAVELNPPLSETQPGGRGEASEALCLLGRCGLRDEREPTVGEAATPFRLTLTDDLDRLNTPKAGESLALTGVERMHHAMLHIHARIEAGLSTLDLNLDSEGEPPLAVVCAQFLQCGSPGVDVHLRNTSAGVAGTESDSLVRIGRGRELR